jgi:hypothetical protein
MNKTITIRFTSDEVFAMYREHKTPDTLNGYQLDKLYSAHRKIEKALTRGR